MEAYLDFRYKLYYTQPQSPIYHEFIRDTHYFEIGD